MNRAPSSPPRRAARRGDVTLETPRSLGAGGQVPDDAVASVGREDDDGGDGGLERAVQVGEALDVQHVDLVHEQHARDQLGHALVNVLVHHLVDLPPEFI